MSPAGETEGHGDAVGKTTMNSTCSSTKVSKEGFERQGHRQPVGTSMGPRRPEVPGADSVLAPTRLPSQSYERYLLL